MSLSSFSHYDPDQPRDESGKWSSTGAGEKASRVRDAMKANTQKAARNSIAANEALKKLAAVKHGSVTYFRGSKDLAKKLRDKGHEVTRLYGDRYGALDKGAKLDHEHDPSQFPIKG